MSACVTTAIHGNVLVITMDRPSARNAIDNDLADGLLASVRTLDDDPALAVGVITGAGPGFCAGMDLKAFAAKGFPASLGPFYADGSRKPLIAAVEGYALGGGMEVALTCDLIVASAGAKLGNPEVTFGLFAAGGALFRLPRRVPYSIAMEIALTGAPVTAELGFRHGLVNRLVEPGRALNTALALAEVIAANAPLAVQVSKALVQEMNHQSEADYWQAQQDPLRRIVRTADSKEGPRSFAEKRKPNWSAS
jgi:enoyl-CoA hydratase